MVNLVLQWSAVVGVLWLTWYYSGRRLWVFYGWLGITVVGGCGCSMVNLVLQWSAVVGVLWLTCCYCGRRLWVFYGWLSVTVVSCCMNSLRLDCCFSGRRLDEVGRMGKLLSLVWERVALPGERMWTSPAPAWWKELLWRRYSVEAMHNDHVPRYASSSIRLFRELLYIYNIYIMARTRLHRWTHLHQTHYVYRWSYNNGNDIIISI